VATHLISELPEIPGMKISRPGDSIILPFEPKLNLTAALTHSRRIASERVEKELGANYPEDVAALAEAPADFSSATPQPADYTIETDCMPCQKLKLQKNPGRGFPARMNPANLLSDITTYVEGLFQAHRCHYLLYHNLDHTRRVVHHAKEIASQYALDDHSFFVLLAAAWFHDTGQVMGDAEGHEEKSVQIMRSFLTGKGIDEKAVNDISCCIRATKMPAVPTTLLEQVICDADTYHLGTKDFPRIDSLVWEEIEQRLNKIVSNKPQKSLSFLENHKFFTSYCQQLLSTGKEENIALLSSRCKNEIFLK
jgi:HD superfamily phosphodiesterase